MMTTRRQWLTDTLAGAALGSLAGPWAAFAAPAGRPLVLGQSVPLTGDASEIGLAFAAGAKLYIDSYNSRSDIPARIELRQVDDAYDATRAAANAKQLLAEGADVLFGFVGTASSVAAADVAKAQSSLLVAPFAAPDLLRDAAHAQVFHVRPSMADEAFKMVQHCATMGLTRIALLGEEGLMGQAGQAAVSGALASLKLPPLVATAFVALNGAQVSAAVTQVKAANPQAIIQASLFKSTAAFIRGMRKSGYAGAFLNFSAVGIDPLYTALGKDIGGVVVSQVVPSPAMQGYDAGGFRVNLRGATREAAAAIDLVSISADGRVIR
ncbi:MAG: ABC transporter substrate-binding protein [Variovorax sp.]|nr:MAG: ABC transporter substrate-binding protein [Variovorax sp.]